MNHIQAGLADASNHYLVCTNYFETPDGPVLLGSLYLHRDAVRNLRVEANRFTCDVLLNPNKFSPVTVSFAQIWSIQRGNQPEFDAEDSAGSLYENTQALSSFAQQGLAE
ncbi:hypothetical protein [Hymenobacter latericus]|uniref:hypothetical protein n=1 Tax=Hymenobacter sp. YIM 151858-1 TaxID=2987688 RepID=UPI0022276555|nr:hypothetical protein [Hymenobacter sp. YIM 151858-1]UYZ61224.1 hypothetical protein OIS50_19840 [Hymenobacter sp. YIM 151858-1]